MLQEVYALKTLEGQEKEINRKKKINSLKTSAANPALLFQSWTVIPADISILLFSARLQIIWMKWMNEIKISGGKMLVSMQYSQL